MIPMTPMPAGGYTEPGALVWGSQYNMASAQLYRWWSLVGAPAGTNTARFWSNLFEEDVQLITPELRAGSLGSVQAALAAADRAILHAHHVSHEDVYLAWLEPGLLELRASLVVQREAEGATVSQRRRCVAVLCETAEGELLFRKIEETVDAEERNSAFAPSYLDNRARATSTRFQAHMDTLTGRTDGMRDLMMPVLELHGLVAAKRDESAADADYSDVNDLRKSIAGANELPANVIRDFAGFSEWFATAPALFNYGLHRLERLEVKRLPERRYEVLAQYEWVAETVNGARIETHHPLTWVMVETDEAYLRIEKLLPFG